MSSKRSGNSPLKRQRDDEETRAALQARERYDAEHPPQYRPPVGAEIDDVTAYPKGRWMTTREDAAQLLRDEFDWPNDEMGVRHSLAVVDALRESGLLNDQLYESYPDSEVAVSNVSAVAHLFQQDDWNRVLDAYVSFMRAVEWITEDVRVRTGFYERRVDVPGETP